MDIVEQSWHFIDRIAPAEMIGLIEYAARLCYQSEKRSIGRLVKDCIRNKHHSVLEHVKISVHITTDRGVSHEFVRHRIASYSQESTRWCNYATSLGIKFVNPVDFKLMKEDMELLEAIENHYNWSIGIGRSPQQARYFLPNGLKTEFVCTMNIREWRLFFSTRSLGMTGKPHPQMRALATSMLKGFANALPELFGDLLEFVE